ncbi:MAG: transketolase [Magnetococcales bacterium]|nr:transketolase [Magnetococcales bacterium]
MDERSRYLRRLIIRALAGAGRGHPGSALSLVEILRVLYDHALHYRADDPFHPDRDRLLLSKGHGCLALYAILADKGFFPATQLDQFCSMEGILGGLPERGRIPGVEASAGSLGHGLSLGVGMALAARIKQKKHRVVVILGDGEINEGSIWEAAMSAAKYRLDRLLGLLDYNKFQSWGPSSKIQNLEPLADKWRSFGWQVHEVDGHDVAALKQVLAPLPLTEGRPTFVICHTVKGKGFPFAEHVAAWHHKSNIGPEMVSMMEKALE